MEIVQAPKVEPGASGRLRYDKTKRMIVGTQAKEPHHLAQFGYRRPPQWLWRVSPRAWVVVSALQDIWLIAIGRATLHRAWQAGHDNGTRMEYERTIINGGR